MDSLKEITLTFIRQAKPVGLLKRFQEWGFGVTEYETGIYHVKKPGHMDMQIIVTKLLDKKYKWITKLSDQVELDDIRSMMEEVEKLTDERVLIGTDRQKSSALCTSYLSIVPKLILRPLGLNSLSTLRIPET